MNALIKEIKRLNQSKLLNTIDKRLLEFQKTNKKSSKYWFFELCFCLLTANTSAKMGLKMQKEIGIDGFTHNKTEFDLAKKLNAAHCRFYNRRAHFIHLACRYSKNIKETLKQKTKEEKREWLISNIKGLGYKEASHFLRNTGHFEYAILDKHILRTLHENKLIDKLPKSLNKKTYLEYEKILEKISKKLNMSQGKLDMYLWYMKTKTVLK
jgi:N-glycosylase/DNA lyase